MPMILPSVLLHSPLGSKHTSPAHSQRTSPRLGPQEASSSTPSLVRPLMSKRYHSTPNTPTLKSNKHNHQLHEDKRSSYLAPQSQTLPHSPVSPVCPIRMSFNIESPPAVLYGSPRESTGALLSGLFRLEVLDHAVPMKSVKLYVAQKVICKKPISGTHTHHTHKKQSHYRHSNLAETCTDCTVHKIELARWDVLQTTTTLPKRTHAYPFSHLLPGSLPATTNNAVFQVEYSLNAEAVEQNGKMHNIKLPVKVSRSIIQTSERNSVRVFPPTELTGNIKLPSVVHPNATFPFEMSLDGVSVDSGSSSSGNQPSKSRWRMRKVNWRIDETAKMKPPACAQHNADANVSVVEETRIIGSGELKSGWKTDFSGRGKIEMGAVDLRTTAQDVSCNIDDPTLGLSVSHVMVVELVVAEETVTSRSLTKQAVPTGAARVLRMQFNLNVTERSGLGIAWDDEVPPVYADIPLSPPDYDTIVTLPKIEDHAPPDGCERFVQGINERLALAQL